MFTRRKKKNEYIDNGLFYEIKIISKKYGCVFAKIDKDDFDKCKDKTWGVHFAKNNNSLYVVTHWKYPQKGKIDLHRFIMNTECGFLVDHINHDTLDNRKKNLRNCSHIINNCNKNGACKNSKLGIRNVRFSQKLNKYLVRIKQKHIGCFKTIEEAISVAEEYREKMLNH